MSKEKSMYSVDPRDRVGPGEKLCYSIGYAGAEGFSTIINSYLMLFLMMVGGVSGTFIGTMMLCARIWDAINDPILGTLADHTHTRFGRYRPYTLAAIPMAIIFALLFFVPDLSTTGKMVYYTIVYILYGMCFTVLELPYFGLASAMTNNPQERASITSWSRIAARIPAVAFPLLLSWLTVQLGDQQGYFVNALCVGGIAIVCALFAFFGCKERAVRYDDEPKEEGKKKSSSFRDFINVIKGNRALIVVMIVQLFFTFNTILSEMINTYYLTYSLGSPALLTGVGVALIAVGCCIGQFFYPYVATKVQSCKVIMMIGVPIYCGMLALCYVAGNISIPLYLVMIVITNVFTGALQINVINLCFEVCDKLEYKNGVRSDATVFSIVSFLMKLSAGLASTIAGFGLTLVGFEGMGEVTIEVTQEMANGVAVLRFLMPGIFAAISFVAVLFYPIKKSEIVEIRAELTRRHADDYKDEEQQ